MKNNEYSADDFNLQTLDRSLYKSYKAKKITLWEMACELHKAGWTNFVNEDYAKKIIDEFNNEI